MNTPAPLCQRTRSQLSDFHDGRLSLQDKDAVRAHLDTCASCFSEYTDFASLFDDLSALPEEVAPSSLPRQFARRLHAARRAEERESGNTRRWTFLPAWSLRLAAALALSGAGVWLGVRWEASAQREAATQRELLALREKVDLMTRLVPGGTTLSQPASVRLASLGSEQSQTEDPRHLARLLGSLAFDPSTNVRLSALEALYTHADQTLVRQGVLAALPRERSPLVQLAMIDFLSTTSEPGSAEVLNTVLRDKGTDKTVRSAAKRALDRL